MKRYLFFLILVSFTQISMAQLFTKERILNLENFDKARLSWGYYLGFNSFDFKFKYIDNVDQEPPFGPNLPGEEGIKTDIQLVKNFGFNVGLIGDLRINDYLNLRFEPGFYHTQRNLTFPDLDESFQGEKDYLRQVKSSYIHFPLLLKVSTKRINNFKPFIIGGVSTAINLSSGEKSLKDNPQGEFRMKTNPLYYELGFGVDLYFFYFKFTPSIRGVFSIKDELIRDNDPSSPWTRNIQSMESRAVFINFTFQ